jgi:hypothetical protein
MSGGGGLDTVLQAVREADQDCRLAGPGLQSVCPVLQTPGVRRAMQHVLIQGGDEVAGAERPVILLGFGGADQRLCHLRWRIAVAQGGQPIGQAGGVGDPVEGRLIEPLGLGGGYGFGLVLRAFREADQNRATAHAGGELPIPELRPRGIRRPAQHVLIQLVDEGVIGQSTVVLDELGGGGETGGDRGERRARVVDLRRPVFQAGHIGRAISPGPSTS